MRLLQVCTLQEGLKALPHGTEEVAEEEEDVVVDSPVVSILGTVAAEENEDVVVDGPSRDCAAEPGTHTQQFGPAGAFFCSGARLAMKARDSLPTPGTLFIYYSLRAARPCMSQEG